jgi:hypothetical protein
MDEKAELYQDPRKLCTHRFEPGASGPARTCGSPALRGQKFCYFHHPTRRPVRTPQSGREVRRARRIARQSFAITQPTNRLELQLSLNEVMRRIAVNQIDLRRATLLVSALELTSRNLPPL